MHLFGRDDEPHLVHFEAHRMPRYVTLTWDVKHAPALKWRVLRSETGYADAAGDDSVVGSGQTLVTEQDSPGSRHDAVVEGVRYYYTIFSQDDHGDWERQMRVKLDEDDHLALDRSRPGDFEEVSPADGYWDGHEEDQVQAALAWRMNHSEIICGPGNETLATRTAMSSRPYLFRHHVPMDV